MPWRALPTAVASVQAARLCRIQTVKAATTTHAKRPRKQHSGRQDYGPIDCVPACCCVCDEVDDDCVLVDHLFAFVPAIAILPRLLVQIVAA
jgi:hypothetical protein